ncbi:hypothetical protein [Brevibacillus sp. H7]|uniref:hypothetical protein n=1 Tax=Brevibacillus sp. H7 TaxID=3349138 RepID=UPI0038296DC0
MSGQKSSRVTVKLNGEKIEKDVKPKVVKAPVQPVVPTIRGTTDEDAFERLLQLRGTANQSSRRETLTESVSPYMPVADGNEEERIPIRYGRSWLKTPAMKTILTTGSAVSIGLLFGFLVLTVFTQEQLSQSYRSVLTGTMQFLTAQELGQRPAASGMQTGPVLPASQNQTAAEGKSVTLQLPELSFFMAQAGAFNLDAPADAAIAPFDKQGIPHLLYRAEDKQYIFAAAAPSRDAILGFASGLKAKGTEVYVKEVTFPGLDKEVTVGQAAGAAQAPDLNTFFLTGLELARILAAQSGGVVNATQPSSPSADEEASLKEKHRRFLEESRAIQVPEEWKPLFTGMVNGMNQAVTAQTKMQEAFAGKKTANAESYAWQVQAGVLTYLENYTKFVQLVK